MNLENLTSSLIAKTAVDTLAPSLLSATTALQPPQTTIALREALLTKIFTEGMRVAQIVEDMSPGHINGMRKLDECRRIGETAKRVGYELQFTEHQTTLLTSVFASHDLGRLMQGLIELNVTNPEKYPLHDEVLASPIAMSICEIAKTKKSAELAIYLNESHAVLSVDLLERHNLLHSLTKQDRIDVLTAVLHHNSKNTPEVSNSFTIFAQSMCNGLKASDRFDLIVRSVKKFFLPRGSGTLLTQLRTYLLPSLPELKEPRGEPTEEAHHNFLAAARWYESFLQDSTTAIPSEYPWIADFKRVLTEQIPEFLMQKFEAGGPADRPQVINAASYAGYILFFSCLIGELPEGLRRRILGDNVAAGEEDIGVHLLKNLASVGVCDKHLSRIRTRLGNMCRELRINHPELCSQ